MKGCFKKNPLIWDLVRRYALFLCSLFFSGISVAITRKAELGVSPISSVANVLSIQFPMLSLGNWLIIWNCLLILGQIILLRKKFQFVQFLQIPISFLFGWFTDFGVWIFSYIQINAYWERLLFVAIGTIALGFSISLSVIANVIMNSGEAFVNAISLSVNKPFGNIKVIFDISCVVAAVILSLLFFHFQLVGTREGTIITAICTGFAVKFFDKLLRKPIEKILIGKSSTFLNS